MPVFLGFVTFYILSYLIETGFFSKKNQLFVLPFYVFSFGIIANEALLLFQGLQILFKTNSYLYTWLLWIASIVLFLGALLIAITGFDLNPNKKATGKPMAKINI